VTAGGTAEPIDPVRFIGNRSTGKMGVAIAQAALDRGADVTLIHGMTSVPLPEEATLVSAPTAAEMRKAVLSVVVDADALVMAAAVADFRPRQVADSKIARDGSGLSLELEPTSDILAEAVQVARQRATPPIVVGFAAETGSLARARDKATRKGVDLLVANDVAEDGSGFGTDTNRVTLVVPGGEDEEWPLMSKRQVADRLLDRVHAVRAARAARGAELAAT
jgi:phosphopantothenoylcysteine decarboxylase/phosphopantothenate--cysteine ligase